MEKAEFFQLMERYLESLKQRGYAPATLVYKRLYLRTLGAYLEQSGKEIRAVTSKDLEQYVRYLTFHYKPKYREKLAERSLLSQVSSVRRFFWYLEKHDLILLDPALSLPYPKVERNSPRPILATGEMEALLSSPNKDNLIGIRDQAILEVLYSTAIRAGELIKLNLLDLDLKERLLRIEKGKGGKDRIVPLGKVAAQALLRYLTTARPLLIRTPKQSALFVSQHGHRLDKSALHQRIQKYREQVGLPKKVSAHVFRHTCATHLLEAGADIRYIQELLGHASAETTQIYARFSAQNLGEILRKCHPRGKTKIPLEESS